MCRDVAIDHADSKLDSISNKVLYACLKGHAPSNLSLESITITSKLKLKSFGIKKTLFQIRKERACAYQSSYPKRARPSLMLSFETCSNFCAFSASILFCSLSTIVFPSICFPRAGGVIPYQRKRRRRTQTGKYSGFVPYIEMVRYKRASLPRLIPCFHAVSFLLPGCMACWLFDAD